MLAAAAALPLAVQAQNVGIGTATPNAKAALEISATNKGLLIPRLTQAQRTAIVSPPDGLMVFQTDNTTGFWYAFGGNWVSIPNANTATPTGPAGGVLSGTYPSPGLATNAVTNAAVADDAIGIAELSATGTASATTFLRGDNTWATIPNSGWSLSGNTLNGNQFIGSLNDEDLIVKRNNAEAFRVFANGRVTLGNNSPGSSSVMLGFNAGVGLTTANYNVIVGARSGQSLNNNFSTFVGYGAGQNTTGGGNTLLGGQAGIRLTSGTNNVFIGNNAGYTSSTDITGSNNIVVGASAGSDLTSNANNILIGGSSQASAGLYDAYALGNGASVAQGNSLVLGNSRGSNDAVSVGIGTSAPSSSLQVNGTFAVGVVTNYGGSGSASSPNGLDQGAINSTTLIGGYYVLNPTSTSNQYYSLPAASACPGRIYYLRNNSTTTNAIISAAGGSVFAGSSSTASPYTLYASPNANQAKTVVAISDGTNWTLGKLD
ncbi:hypothetical protein GCM10027345_44450 [Hymenobacter daeguensis]